MAFQLTEKHLSKMIFSDLVWQKNRYPRPATQCTSSNAVFCWHKVCHVLCFFCTRWIRWVLWCVQQSCDEDEDNDQNEDENGGGDDDDGDDDGDDDDDDDDDDGCCYYYY